MTRIHQEKVHSFYGPFDAATLSASAAACIASNSAGDADRLTAVLGRFLDHARGDCIAEAAPLDKPQVTQACWLAVRVFKPSKEYEVPRCTATGVCSPALARQPRKGKRQNRCRCRRRRLQETARQRRIPSTPSRCWAPRRVCSSPTKRWKTPSRMWRTAWGGSMSHGCGPSSPKPSRGARSVMSWERGQVIRFSWGQDDAPVHSEPDFGGKGRVFVSVLFGGEEEIRDMCRRRRETFGAVRVRGGG
ncbi:hypothetical protein PG994_007490 [Apiospora phragmitis]|uniref:Uncharacterized protein n=1 Tax=Apiospora phragmitis TaxID=2905665 RepID=A0ABR1V1P6_9PEZI